MATDYTCSFCGLKISVGSYHGFGADGWFNALYCRHCGTRYTLNQTTAQFLRVFDAEKTERNNLEFEVSGPQTTHRVVAAAHLPVPRLTCEVCKAEGPFGPDGPITDEPPKGLGFDQECPPGHGRILPHGKCPKCKQQTMKVSGSHETSFAMAGKTER